MPRYSFICSNCQHGFDDYVDVKIKELECPDCSSVSARQLPKLGGAPEVTEVVDKFLGTKHKKDQKELIKERNEEFYWKVEVPRLAADPIYGLDTKLENGWIWVDDSGKINVHTKPPHKR